MSNLLQLFNREILELGISLEDFLELQEICGQHVRLLLRSLELANFLEVLWQNEIILLERIKVVR